MRQRCVERSYLGRRFRSHWAWISLLAAVAVAGCGPSGPPTYRVFGTVTWQGEPIDKGRIIIESADRRVRAQSVEIVHGKYDLRMEACRAMIRIFASRERTDGKPSGRATDSAMGSPALEHYIPAQFNVNTRLEREIAPRDNELNFSLTPEGDGS